MKEKYLEMENIAKKLEELRKELYQNKKHQELQGKEDFQYINDKMLRIQSALRELSEYCLLEIND